VTFHQVNSQQQVKNVNNSQQHQQQSTTSTTDPQHQDTSNIFNSFQQWDIFNNIQYGIIQDSTPGYFPTFQH
jgi:hypothetical protein